MELLNRTVYKVFMSKILFATDFHHGFDFTPRFDGDLQLLGREWAIPMLNGLVNYAHSSAEEVALISGGDEVTLIPEKATQNDQSEAARIHLEHATQMGDIFRMMSLNHARAFGNHDVLTHLSDVGFNSSSHAFDKHPLPDTDVIICQPCVTVNGKPTFEYNADAIRDIISSSRSPNLVIVSHFPLMNEGRDKPGYRYIDRGPEILDYIQSRISSGQLSSVITLHGHSHCYRERPLQDDFSVVTVPAIVQSNSPVPFGHIPGGPFCELTVDPKTGKLKHQFQEMTLADNHGQAPIVRRISKTAMAKKYFKPVKPAGYTA